ncbi:protein-disulfide reductase DsbD domain-containing protein [Shimia ponticola]|uniref:protein-disulfide reductase DsbD domain-containing protein n=1 Tax=Shimia ponticola TaxID=2582893 RepID=UPI0011BF104F|nr:protein-disulfide reductase DsbD domain-containing protein [Shimia ponticola]
MHKLWTFLRRSAAVASTCLVASTGAAMSLDEVIDAKVLTGWRADNGDHIAALHVTLAPGWKTYWRAPGDAGIPTQFDFSGSQNMTGHSTHWPVPKVFWQNGMRSIGYEGQVVLPLRIATVDPAAPVQIDAKVSMGVCEEICIPAHLQIRATLPATDNTDPMIRSALADRPMTETEASVGPVVCHIEPLHDGLRLHVQVTMPKVGPSEVAAIETADKSVWVAEPKVERDGATLVAVTELVPPQSAPFALDRSGIRVTVFGRNQAVDIRGCTAN